MDKIDARSHARQAFGITASEKPMRVRLLFEAKLAVHISERQWHASQVLKKRHDGAFEMARNGWVLSWKPDVRVLAQKACGRESP